MWRTRAEEVKPLSLAQCELRRPSCVPNAEGADPPVLRRNHDRIRRLKPEDFYCDAGHGGLRERLHVIVGLDVTDADKCDQQHEVAAGCKHLILPIQVRLLDEREHKHEEANEHSDNHTGERVALIDQQHPTRKGCPPRKLEKLPIEVLRMIIAHQKGDGSHEAIRHVMNNVLARREEQRSVQNEYAERPKSNQQESVVANPAVLFAFA
eukprot:2762623-Prymnesium_polylepis.1